MGRLGDQCEAMAMCYVLHVSNVHFIVLVFVLNHFTQRAHSLENLSSEWNRGPVCSTGDWDLGLPTKFSTSIHWIVKSRDLFSINIWLPQTRPKIRLWCTRSVDEWIPWMQGQPWMRCDGASRFHLLGLTAYSLFLLCRLVLSSMDDRPPSMKLEPQSWMIGHEMGYRVHECVRLSMDKSGIHGKSPSIHGSRATNS